MHEIKFDGYRLQAQVRGGAVEAADAQRAGLDRAVRGGGDGGADGTAGQGGDPRRRARRRGRRRRVGLLGAAGRSRRRAQRPLRLLPLRSPLPRRRGSARRCRSSSARRGWRRCSGARTSRCGYSEHFEEDGEVMLQHACRLSLEGLVSKQRDGGLSDRSDQGLDQVEMLGAPGVRHRRLRAIDGLARARRLAGARLLPRRQARPCRPRRHRASAARSPRSWPRG